MRKVSLIALMLCLVAGVVNAEIITVQAIAEITQFDDHGGYFDDSISVGTALTMTYSYDTEVSGTIMPTGTTWYQQDESISLSIGSYNFTNNSLDIFVGNDETDKYQVGATLSTNIASNATFNMLLSDSSGTVLLSEELPLPDFDIDNWDYSQITFILDREFDITANVNSIQIIPEPVSLLLFGLGGLFLKKNTKRGLGVLR